MKSIVALVLLALAAVAIADFPLQMRGYITSPSGTNSYSFDIIPSTDCQLVDTNEQWGNLYVPVSECNSTGLTLIFGTACTLGSYQPVSTNSTATGFEYHATFYWGPINGITYTDGYFSCYEPTPSQLITPTAAPVHVISDEPSAPGSSPNSASTVTLSLASILLALLALFL